MSLLAVNLKARNGVFIATLAVMKTQPEDFGYATEAECIQMISLFVGIGDAKVRRKVLSLLSALATETGELLTLEEVLTFQ
jgi:hypothetical protein